MKTLQGVGSAALGEWDEWTGRAYHIRRRLSEREAKATGPVVDIRGTPEAKARIDRVARYLPPLQAVRDVVEEEMRVP